MFFFVFNHSKNMLNSKTNNLWHPIKFNKQKLHKSSYTAMKPTDNFNFTAD